MKKTLILLCLLLLAGTLYAQTQTVPSSNENYIYTKNYLDYPASGDPKVAETVQYFDKLGRPIQLINVKATPQGKDLVTPINYDEFGRQVDSWLPSPMNTYMEPFSQALIRMLQIIMEITFPLLTKTLKLLR
ncbi:DUF6443 domain-containing protein [Chryseobacterium sp. 1B4]